MQDIILKASSEKGLAHGEIIEALKKTLKEQGKELKKVLLLPPDITRAYSGAGMITAEYYNMLKGNCEVDIMPALGTHEAMSQKECLEFFGRGGSL